MKTCKCIKEREDLSGLNLDDGLIVNGLYKYCYEEEKFGSNVIISWLVVYSYDESFIHLKFNKFEAFALYFEDLYESRKRKIEMLYETQIK